MLGSTSLGTRASAATLVAFAMRATSNAEERASAAVRLIAEVSAARTVHLYLVQADGTVRWAASQSERPQGAVELAQAQQCLARALDDDFGSTQIVSEVDSTLTHTSGMWSDPSGLGHGHGAQLLTVSDKSGSRHVAVVLAISPRSRAQSQSILSALAEHLLKLGDTEGLAV
jgi:GAF domain-containing protein